MNNKEGAVRLSLERLETLLFKERKTRRATLKRKRNLAEKIMELNERFATAAAEVSEHDRRVAMFEEAIEENLTSV